jgi:NAD(P)H-dependent flavin oxidoreductase YrpB (nitropropane dioxygenase family)
MYSTRFDISKSTTSSEAPNKNIEAGTKQTGAIAKESTNSSNNVVTQIVSEKGYQKVVEVYSEYKAKGLIAPDFPEITFAQLMNKLELFEQNVINSYTKVDVEPEFMPAGQGVGAIKSIVHAGDLVRSMMAEAEHSLDRIQAMRK